VDRGSPADPVLAQAHAYFDDFADEYDPSADDAGWLPNALLEAELPAVGPVRRAADLACGTGRTLAVLRGAYPDAILTGVDFSASMLDAARSRLGTDPSEPARSVRLVQADLASFAADGGPAFDLVTVLGGLEFVADLPSALVAVGSLVRPGGHLIATYEPVIAGMASQEARVETNLGSNGGLLTTFRWEAHEVAAALDGWEQVRDRLIVGYRRADLPVVYGWLHYRRPD
jgi:ubiquinone/menaquinone biosynthesis C-methylase UbiE